MALASLLSFRRRCINCSMTLLSDKSIVRNSSAILNNSVYPFRLIKIAEEFLTMDLSDDNVIEAFMNRLRDDSSETSAMEVEE